jgi:sodium/potassium-transporting ATPase subunit alpha
MGITGSDVAKDAADVIFMDDDFTNIVIGINEGRRLFDNLKKSAAYTLSHLIPEAVPILMELAFGLPLALNALLIISIDMGTEMMPAISYA